MNSTIVHKFVKKDSLFENTFKTFNNLKYKQNKNEHVKKNNNTKRR